jgi:hypothetical protein
MPRLLAIGRGFRYFLEATPLFSTWNAMGISIKREDTERLAREVAKLKGESLADAIHHALEGELVRLEATRKTPAQILADLQPFFARLDALGPGNGKSLKEIEDEMYGEFGEPI